MSRRWVVALVAFVVVGVAGGVAWLAARAPAVPALTVAAAPLLRTLQFSARVASLSRVEVGSTVTGRVLQVLVADGAAVKAGDVLLRLESDELRAALAQAEAAERQATARLAGLRSTGRSAVRAGLAQAESVLAAAQAELQRTQDLVAQGFVSTARLDEARRAAEVALAQRDSARAQGLANDEQGTDVAQAQAASALAAAATAAARARLAQSVITAPADGRVLLRSVEPGQIVQPGRALLTLALAGPLELVAQVDERYLEQLQPGQAASVLADAFPAQRFAARVQSLAPRVDAQRGAVEVKLVPVQAPPPFLREDMTLSVEVETGRRPRALSLPLAALRSAPAGAAAAEVLVLRDGRAEARAVTLGLRTLTAAEVLSGLAEGEVVLLDGALTPGRRARADFSAGAAAAARRASGDDAGSALSNAMGR